MHLVVAWHELGHLLAAIAGKARPQALLVGRGPLLWRREASNGFLIEWRALPISGLVALRSSIFQPARWRQFLFIAAGPIASALLSLALWLLYWHASQVGTHAGAWAGASTRSLFFVALLSLFTFLESLIPYETDLYGQTRGSDGLQILRLFWPHVPKVTRKNAALTDFDRRMAALTIRRSFKTSPCSSPLAATSGTA
jgi:hypothetical protein